MSDLRPPAYGGTAAAAQQQLIPALLLAAAINADGNIDLATGEDGPVGTVARAAFCLGSQGELFQKRYWTARSTRFSQVVTARWGEAEPLDMLFLSACVTHTFGEHTPLLFRLEATEAGSGPCLAQPGEERDRQRVKVLYDAFTIHLLAYEEHLV